MWWGLLIVVVLLLSADTCWVAPLRVVTTVAPIADLVQQVGGANIQLHGLVPPGMNSHTFQPTPSDVKYLAQADLVILNGLHLEISTEKLAQSVGKTGLVFLHLGDRTISQDDWVFDFSFPKASGHPNPHLWLNVAYAMQYVVLIRNKLTEIDPKNGSIYQNNAARLLTVLEQLDHCISAATQTIPAAHRKLLTYHDSWPYFAKRYGLTVVGVIQSADFSEPSPREMARIINQLRKEKVPAIFGSEVFPSKTLEKIAREALVYYIISLHDDVLPGTPGEPQHSYIGMMTTNVITIVEALGGESRPVTRCFER